MKLALLIIILFSFISQAQSLHVTGEIKVDSTFSCIDPIQPDSLEFGINEICHSGNYIEIRLKTSILATSELIILSFNNNEWIAEKYYPEYKTKGRKVISTSMMKMVKNDSAGLLMSIFDSLKSKHLFLLPDQRTVTKRTINESVIIVSDGVLYTITYKVGNLYRRYHYGNPEIFAKHYPKEPEYKQVTAIIQLLDNIF